MVFKVEEKMIPVKTANVGDRIECMGHFGTVKYVGLVKGYPDSWLGVDWDDKNRGKHNGTVGGIVYFTASYDTSGSFVRPEKVQLGRSAVVAITSRYGQREDEASAKLTEQQLLCIKQTINAPFIHLVGFEKVVDMQSDFRTLKIVNLRLQNVSNIGEPNEFKEICPNIVELDISKNLLTDWTSIFEICAQLEHLQWLNVSENLLNIPEDYNNFRFPKVKVLIGGYMRLNWSDMLKLCRVFCQVEELRVPHNNVTDLTTPEGELEYVRVLDLESNPIQDWDEVCKLTVLRSLEHINLENTGIAKIKFNNSNVFRHLRRLVITGNLINDWESVGELNKIPTLEDLRFIKNPIMETESYATCIQLIIARVANIRMFNGALIRSDERKGAEYDYIKKYGLEWLSVKDNPEKRQEFLKIHNRYEELLGIYGTPEESELAVHSKLIKVSLVEIAFRHGDRIVNKRLPPSILVQKLIMLAQRLFNLQNRPILTYISGKESEIEIDLIDEGKELGFYSIQDGDKIIVKS